MKQESRTYVWNQPEWVTELQREIEMLHAENALKLTQILDLEQLLYEVRHRGMPDGSPCWCRYPIGINHSLNCEQARQATEMFWKK